MYLLCNEIKGVMISTLNDGTDILMVRTLSVKNQKKLRNRKEIWSVSQPFTWLPMFFLRITYLKPMPLKTCSILTLHRYRGVDLIIQCTYFAVSSLNFGLHPWGSVPEIHLRKFSNHPEVSSMTSSVTSSPVKYVPKTNKNTPSLNYMKGIRWKLFLWSDSSP